MHQPRIGNVSVDLKVLVDHGYEATMNNKQQQPTAENPMQLLVFPVDGLSTRSPNDPEKESDTPNNCRLVKEPTNMVIYNL